MKVNSLSHVQLFSTPWTAAHQAPLSMGFSRQEYWSGPHYRRILYHLNHKESPRNEYTSVKTLFFLREEGKGNFKTKLRVAVINGGKQQAGITKIHIQGAGSENVKLSHF